MKIKHYTIGRILREHIADEAARTTIYDAFYERDHETKMLRSKINNILGTIDWTLP